jgi:hypothetical protein
MRVCVWVGKLVEATSKFSSTNPASCKASNLKAISFASSESGMAWQFRQALSKTR